MKLQRDNRASALGSAGFGVLMGLAAFALGASCAPTLFRDATDLAGIDHAGQSWGAAWGDWNGDGLADLFLPNHGDPPSLYVAQGDGTFVDLGLALIGDDSGDMHQAAWIDVDGDGDQDLYEVGGGSGGEIPSPNRLFLNTSGAMVDAAALLGLDVPDGRGRSAQWWDWDQDGRLDVAVQNRVGGGDLSRLYVQEPDGSFTGTNLLPETAGFRSPLHAQLADLDDDGDLEMVSVGWPPAVAIYDIDGTGFQNVTSEFGLPSLGTVHDVAIGDFDGDLDLDLLMLHHRPAPYSELFQPSAGELRARIAPDGDARGVDFASAGITSFKFDWWRWESSQIFIGASAANPANRKEVFLSSDDPAVHGLPTFEPGVDSGVYLGFDPVAGVWQVRVSDPGLDELGLLVSNPAGISSVAAVGFDPTEEPRRRSDWLYLNEGGVFVDRTVGSGLDDPTRCHSVGVGDFDNDADLDLYYVCTSMARNLPNRLFRNRGDGSFVEAGAGPAAGPAVGQGDGVSVADYDGDGSLDLLVTNGWGNPPLHDGPTRLFRNNGGGNHWLQLDLEGTASNREAIGARVIVEAGGTAQVRFQTGGFHGPSQDHRRLHFGLGKADVAQRVTVDWPSGATTVLEDVAADQLLEVLEP